MQVIITMAGNSQRYIDEGFNPPKSFIKIDDHYMIDLLIKQFPPEWKLFFVVQNNLEQKYLNYLDAIGKVVLVNYSERGPLDSVLACYDVLNFTVPTIVTYCDFSFKWNTLDFLSKVNESDAAVLGITGFHSTFSGPNSYCHYLVKNGFVTELQEKKLFSDNIEKEWTSCGLYYFKSAEFLKKCLHLQIDQDLKYQTGEYYISLALQAALNSESSLKILNYPIDQFIQFGTPYDLKMYLYWKNIFK